MKSFRRIRQDESVDINLAPMVDMIFILLIFFIVTTSFVHESGIEVDRPVAKSATSSTDMTVIIGVSAEGLIYIDGDQLDVRALRPRMERYVAERPMSAVVVVADRDCPTGITVRVLDECRLAGVRSVSVGARTVDGGFTTPLKGGSAP